MSAPGTDSAGPAPGSRRDPRVNPPLVYRPTTIGLLVAGVGVGVFLLGLLSSIYIEPAVYRDAFTGYDPPFDAVAGLLLLALALRIRDRSLVAWLFSLLAPALTISIAVLSPNLFSIAAAGAATLLVPIIYPYRSGFYRGSATGPEATQLLVVVSALLTVLFGMVGSRYLAQEFSPSIGGWGDSLYFTVATVSTNGTNFSPVTDSARIFVVLLILFGVGTFLTAVVVLFVPFLERRLVAITARLERAQMEELHDHVIICGATLEARAAATTLRQLGVSSVLLSTDSKSVEALQADGFRTHLGDPSSEDVLREVGIDRARALIAVEHSDAENLLTVITARGLKPALRIVALATQLHALAKLKKAGANEAFSLVTLAGKLVSDAALG